MIDNIDKRILFELEKNARIPDTQLAKIVNKSKDTVRYRIKKLEEVGILIGYTTVIDYSKLGYSSVRVYFKFHNLSPEQQRKLEDTFLAHHRQSLLLRFIKIQTKTSVML